jgi:hypothetical protein
MKNILFLIISILLMTATRGHSNWASSFVHLPDFTIPALFIAGVYFRHSWVAFSIIITAISIDNYAIVEQGVSANCITPAYSFLPVTYYGVFWLSKFITHLKIDKNIVKNSFIIVAIASSQWLSATVSYYVFTATFTKTGWHEFSTYTMHWSIVEIPLALYWMIATVILLSLVPSFNPLFSKHKNA